MAARIVPEVNGRALGWADVVVNIGGVAVNGITGISYSDTETMTNVYGIGQYPVARSYGNIVASASITLYLDEVEAIIKSSPTGRLQDILPFDIIVQFVRDGKAEVTHRIRKAQFKENKIELKPTIDGEPKNATFELIVSHIEWK